MLFYFSWGSVANYLESIGFGREAQEKLRTNLVITWVLEEMGFFFLENCESMQIFLIGTW